MTRRGRTNQSVERRLVGLESAAGADGPKAGGPNEVSDADRELFAEFVRSRVAPDADRESFAEFVEGGGGTP